MTQIIVTGTTIVWHGANDVAVSIGGSGVTIGSPVAEFISVSVAPNPQYFEGVSLPADYLTPGKRYIYRGGEFVDVTPSPPPLTPEQVKAQAEADTKVREADRLRQVVNIYNEKGILK